MRSAEQVRCSQSIHYGSPDNPQRNIRHKEEQDVADFVENVSREVDHVTVFGRYKLKSQLKESAADARWVGVSVGDPPTSLQVAPLASPIVFRDSSALSFRKVLSNRLDQLRGV